jgi:predicted TIM-barrel fold metal-dependent hydrolase
VVKAGIKNVCVHKGLFAPGVEKQFPNLRGFADVADVGQAAKDWPNLNFIIYHWLTATSGAIRLSRSQSSIARSTLVLLR